MQDLLIINSCFFSENLIGMIARSKIFNNFNMIKLGLL